MRREPASAGVEARREAWLRRARGLVLRVRAAALFEAWAPLGLLLAFPAAFVLLVWRRRGLAEPAFWAGFAAAGVLTLIAAAWRARRRVFALPQALARLDVAFGLHSRLVSAHAGVGSWPEAPAAWPPVLRWDLGRTLTPLLFLVLLLAVVRAVPLRREPPGFAGTPPALAEAQSLLDALAEEGLADEQSLRAWQERLDELREKPGSAFDHGRLEAADAAREQLDADVAALERDLEGAGAALEALAREQEPQGGEGGQARLGGGAQKAAAGGAGASAPLDAAARQLDASLRDLQSARLAADPKLSQALREANARSRSLSAAEAKALAAKMRRSAQACKATRGGRAGRLGRAGASGLGQARLRIGKGPVGPLGNGGVDRGPGTRPLSLGEATAADADKLEGLSSEDLDDLVPAEVVQVDQVAPEPEEDVSDPATAGRAAAGRGGEAVWHQAATPEERRVLGRYFR